MKEGVSPQTGSSWPCSSGWLCWRAGAHSWLCHQCFMESLCQSLQLLYDPHLRPRDAMKIKPLMSGCPHTTQGAIKHLPSSGCVLLALQKAAPCTLRVLQVTAGLCRGFARRLLFLIKLYIFFCAPLFRKTVEILRSMHARPACRMQVACSAGQTKARADMCVPWERALEDYVCKSG